MQLHGSPRCPCRSLRHTSCAHPLFRFRFCRRCAGGRLLPCDRHWYQYHRQPTCVCDSTSALKHAEYAATPTTIHIPPHTTCHLDAPITLTDKTHPAGVVLQGSGPTSVLSGGAPVTGWKPVAWPGAPRGAVFAADVRAWPVEIKSLRHGASRVPRSRFPLLDGDGRGTKNWLFAAPW